MTTPVTPDDLAQSVARAAAREDLDTLSQLLAAPGTAEVVAVLERLDDRRRAVVYRLLPKQRALEVFEALPAGLQGDLVQALQDAEVASVFTDLDPDDRVRLLDELPASLAPRLLRDLPDDERAMTHEILGYPRGSTGRRMSPEYVSAHVDDTTVTAMTKVRAGLAHAETVYTLPVLDRGRQVVGVVSLRQLLGSADDDRVGDLMVPADTALATEDAEAAARRCADRGLLAVPVVDAERRLVGILTVDDALRLLEEAESEDAARLAGSEPLRRPYLSTPVRRVVRSRITWLSVLALGATLTVQVLETFEATLQQLTTLALFVPLLIGTGGNTGNQAATTVTRALALDEVRPRDVGAVLLRELRVGALLGALLGGAGFAVAGLVYGADVGAVVGLTLLAVCTMAAAVGGVMPLVARAVRVDPAVFSNPFITTFVDATGLVVYFLIARAVLGL